MANLGSYNGIPVFGSNDPTNVIPPTLINSYSALTIPAYYRAMNVLANNLAAFPRTVHKNGARMDVSHPLDAVLSRRPNNYQNSFMLWRTFFHHAAHHGNAYARVQRTGFTVEGLHNLLPEDVCPFRYDHNGTGLQQFYYHAPTKTVIPGLDVLHISALGYDGMIGLDPVGLMGETFLRAKTLGRFQTRYLMKGTVLRGSIEIPAGISKEQRDDLVSILRNYFQGSDAERDVIVLSEGAKLNNATLSAQDSQIIQQIAANVKEISQITGVPPQFLFEFSDSKYNNSIEQMGLDLVRNTFRPWIEQAEDELTIKLLTSSEQNSGLTIHLNPDALLRGDTKTQSEIVTSQVNGGIRTANEGRAMLDLPAVDDPNADKLRVLGDTTPQANRKGQEPPTPPKESSREPSKGFGALKPVIDATVERIETKTAKAFEGKAGKSLEERTIWVNVFAEQQKTYAIESLQPIAAALLEMDAQALPVAEIAERYAQQVRHHAANGTHKPLAEIITDLYGKTHEQIEG